MPVAEQSVSLEVVDLADFDNQLRIAVGPNGVLSTALKGDQWYQSEEDLQAQLQSLSFQSEPAPENLLTSTEEQIIEYLQGQRKSFDLELDRSLIKDGFQAKVLDVVSRVPYGQTVSYGQLAMRIGHSGASRAVGTALGSNPLAILIPCHRVIRENGDTGEYASGSATKQLLLDLERANSN